MGRIKMTFHRTHHVGTRMVEDGNDTPKERSRWLGDDLAFWHGLLPGLGLRMGNAIVRLEHTPRPVAMFM